MDYSRNINGKRITVIMFIMFLHGRLSIRYIYTTNVPPSRIISNANEERTVGKIYTPIFSNNSCQYCKFRILQFKKNHVFCEMETAAKNF